MRLSVDDTRITITADDGRSAGTYVFSDPFKPYLHPLFTPAGLPMSAFMPHDHKHHRGLMYALRTPELNFWEERPTLPGEQVGRQVHHGLSEVVAAGPAVGFAQQLAWSAVDEEAPILIETRRIGCAMAADDRGYAWTWRTTLEPQVDLTLRMSQWSAPRADGTMINYHGIGLRLPREYGGAQARLRIRLDDRQCSIAEAHGTSPVRIEFTGAADGTWPVRFGGVRFTQNQANALFIMKDPFAYIALGPSNLGPLELKRGEIIDESYAIDVFDADPQEGENNTTT